MFACGWKCTPPVVTTKVHKLQASLTLSAICEVHKSVKDLRFQPDVINNDMFRVVIYEGYKVVMTLSRGMG